LTEKRTYENQQFQDQLDAATIYSMLENLVIPLYYAKNSKGYSPEWIQYVKNSIAQIAPHYTTKRMFEDYINRFYNVLVKRSKSLSFNKFAKAKELAAWKAEVAQYWNEIEVISVNYSNSLGLGVEVGDTIDATIVVDKHRLQGDLGLELVHIYTDPVTNREDIKVHPAQLVKAEGTKLYFRLQVQASQAGNFKYGVRIYPSNSDLPHRMDFAYVKWIAL
jgi:starch phosphorylase